MLIFGEPTYRTEPATAHKWNWSKCPQPSRGIGQGTLNAVAENVLPNLTST